MVHSRRYSNPPETDPEEIIAEAAEAIPEPEEILQDVAAALGLDTGRMTLEQINLVLTHLPVDLTFIYAILLCVIKTDITAAPWKSART